MVAVLLGGQATTTDSGKANQAVALAREDLEKKQVDAKVNYNGLTSSTSQYGEFTRAVSVETVDANTKRVKSRVSWADDPLRVQAVELITLVTNWRDLQASGGDSGGGGTSGDWMNPQTLGSIDLGAGVSATDLDVLNKYVYLSASASDGKKPDIFIVDATNGQTPVILGSTSTGPGLLSIDTASSTAFAGNDKTNEQLHIIDVSNRAAPILKSTFQLPGVSGAGAVGQSIFYNASKIYLGTKSASGPEFHIVDVANELAPASAGSREISADVNMIVVASGIAYIATSDDNEELKILDVSNPANITPLGSFNAAGTADGTSLYLYGTTLYLGRKDSGDPDFYILDAGNPAQIVTLGSKDIGSDINGIVVRDILAFIGTSHANQEFQVWNVSTPANITLWSSFNFPQIATGIDFEDNLVYVSVRSNDALRIITSQ